VNNLSAAAPAMQAVAEAMGPAAGGPPPIPPPMDGAVPPMGGPVMADQPQVEEKQPPLMLPPTLAKRLAQGYVDQVKQMAQLFADHTGHPDDFKRFPLRAQVEAYYRRNPKADPLALKEQGLSAVEIRDKVYPLRRILLKMAGPRPEDRVKYARRMKAERARLDRVEEGASPL
jgi:hypothetical protein